MELLTKLETEKFTILYYDNRIVEVFGHEGFNYTKDDVIGLEKDLMTLSPPFLGYLANRKYKYSFSPTGLTAVMNSRTIDTVAVLVYSRASELISQIIPESLLHFKFRTFRHRDEAIRWLEKVIAEKLKKEEAKT